MAFTTGLFSFLQTSYIFTITLLGGKNMNIIPIILIAPLFLILQDFINILKKKTRFHLKIKLGLLEFEVSAIS